MALFCTKCGARLDDAAKFCTACGTAAGAGPTAGAPSTAPPAPARPAAPTAPATPPAARSGMPTGIKVLLGIVAVVLVVGLLGVAAAGYFAYRLARNNVDIDASSGQVSLQTPEGKVTMGKMGAVSEAELGIPIYPNAKPAEAGFEVSSPKGGVRTFLFTTNDSITQVADFYKEKLGDELKTTVTGPDGAMLGMDGYKGADYLITIGRELGRTNIAITVARKNEPI